MFTKIEFRDDWKKISVDIGRKHYSDFGIMLSKLSELVGIDIETLKSYDDWYILDDGYYYFKIKGIFEELFMSELSHECKVRCVKFRLAEDTSFDHLKLGIISKLYRTKENKYYEYSDFCRKYFGRIPNDLSGFRLLSSITFGEEKTQELMNDIFNVIGLDMFSGQWDREEYNLFFECSNTGIRLAPLCDNGLILSLRTVYSSPFGDFSFGASTDDYCSRKNLLTLLETERKFYENLASLLDINISEVLKRTILKYKIIMDSSDESRILKYFDDKKKSIEYTLKLSRNNR